MGEKDGALERSTFRREWPALGPGRSSPVGVSTGAKPACGRGSRGSCKTRSVPCPPLLVSDCHWSISLWQADR